MRARPDTAVEAVAAAAALGLVAEDAQAAVMTATSAPIPTIFGREERMAKYSRNQGINLNARD
jgi:hypothetical protein